MRAAANQRQSLFTDRRIGAARRRIDTATVAQERAVLGRVPLWPARGSASCKGKIARLRGLSEAEPKGRKIGHSEQKPSAQQHELGLPKAGLSTRGSRNSWRRPDNTPGPWRNGAVLVMEIDNRNVGPVNASRMRPGQLVPFRKRPTSRRRFDTGLDLIEYQASQLRFCAGETMDQGDPAIQPHLRKIAAPSGERR